VDSSVSLKDEIWFLRVCHHVSNGLYTRRKSGKFSHQKSAFRVVKFFVLIVCHEFSDSFLFFCTQFVENISGLCQLTGSLIGFANIRCYHDQQEDAPLYFHLFGDSAASDHYACTAMGAPWYRMLRDLYFVAQSDYTTCHLVAPLWMRFSYEKSQPTTLI
jgi:hypothetical protein